MEKGSAVTQTWPMTAGLLSQDCHLECVRHRAAECWFLSSPSTAALCMPQCPHREHLLPFRRAPHSLREVTWAGGEPCPGFSTAGETAPRMREYWRRRSWGGNGSHTWSSSTFPGSLTVWAPGAHTPGLDTVLFTANQHQVPSRVCWMACWSFTSHCCHSPFLKRIKVNSIAAVFEVFTPQPYTFSWPTDASPELYLAHLVIHMIEGSR